MIGPLRILAAIRLIGFARGVRTRRSRTATTFAWLGIAGATTAGIGCLVGAFRAMRSLTIENGGFCAGGGPHEVVPPCDDNAVLLLLAALPLGLVFMSLRALTTLWIRSPGIGVLPTLGIGCAVLGVNFIDLGAFPPENGERSTGWIVCGVLFWLMAVGLMAPLIWRVPA